MSFEKLTKKELLRTAEEDFAVDVDKSWKKAQVIEALDESGVDFAMYLEANPEKAEEYSEVPANIVQEPLVAPQQPTDEDEPKILIKMLRSNPLFEIRGYRWTQKHPYVAVSVKDAEHILIKEEGFRQATPGELQEYYA